MQEQLIIAGTNKTPTVKLNAQSGLLEITGKSIPENSVGFYQPLYSWVDQYCTGPAPKTEFKVSLEYFNTSSSKCLLDVFRKLEKMNKLGLSKVSIIWQYEVDDEDMLEAGQDYDTLVDLPFHMLPL